MSSRPKGWLAVLLVVVFPPLGFLYVSRANWAAFSFLPWVIISGCAFVFPRMAMPLMAVLIWGFTGICAWIAFREAKLFDADRVRNGYSRWYGLLSFSILIGTLIIGLRAFLLEPFSISSGGMAPTLETGAKVIAEKWGYGNYATYGFHLFRTVPSAALNRGDIIVFEYPANRSLSYVKRLVGLPGDTVSYLNKRLTINGQAVLTTGLPDYFDNESMRYFKHFEEVFDETKVRVITDSDRPAFIPGADQFFGREGCSYTVDGVSCKVPPGHYFMLGDNRDNSLDSRYWGFVPTDHIIGKVIYAFQ